VQPVGSTVTLPTDLAELLIEDGVATSRPPDMSALAGLVETTATVAATCISLAQGPMTAAQVIEYLRVWRWRRTEHEVALGRLVLRTKLGVSVDVDVFEETDLEQVGKSLADLLNAVRANVSSRQVSAFDDDL
jgi:hypothetical protein